MKKLLGIVVLGLLLTGNAYANTPVQQFVFEKLYDEYSKCTVYYKFTGRGIERKKDVAELTEKENLFLNEMNNLSKESEKNMFFFAQKLKISNQDVQSNIKKIYTSFLDIAGRDYSKTEILNEKYYHICISAIEDPESRMVYWDVEFQKTKKNKDKMLVGKKLNCLHGGYTKKLKYNKYSAIEFLPNKKLKLYTINAGDTSNWKIDSDIYGYDITPDKINFKLSTSTISRETLKFLRWGKVSQCELMPIDWNILEFLELTLEKIISQQKNKNQL